MRNFTFMIARVVAGDDEDDARSVLGEMKITENEWELTDVSEDDDE